MKPRIKRPRKRRDPATVVNESPTTVEDRIDIIKQAYNDHIKQAYNDRITGRAPYPAFKTGRTEPGKGAGALLDTDEGVPQSDYVSPTADYYAGLEQKK